MENFSSENIKAQYDHKRFPAVWQALVGCSAMQFTALIPLTLITFVLGSNYAEYFRTEFGEYMFNGVISQFFAVLIIPLFFLLITKKDMRSTLRLKKNLDWFQVLLLVLASAGVFFGAQFINSIFITGLSSFMGEPSEIEGVADATNISQLLFEIVIIAGLPSICEEIFFRGFVMRAFERYSTIGAIVLSSVAFAVMHGNLQQILYAFILGLILGTVVMVTDSLFAGTVMHFTLNAMSIILSYPPIYSQYESFVNNNPLIYFGVAMLILPAIAALCIVFFIKHSRKKNSTLYQKPFVSDMEFPRLMPKPQGWETALTVIGWIAFTVINIFSMLLLWYYDAIMGAASSL